MDIATLVSICGLTVGEAVVLKKTTKEYEDLQVNKDLAVGKVSVKQTQLLFCVITIQIFLATYNAILLLRDGNLANMKLLCLLHLHSTDVFLYIQCILKTLH